MNEEYSYPLDEDWTTEEIVAVVEFFEAVENSYDEGIEAGQFKVHYKNFKQVVPTKSEEKTLFKAFKERSGFEPFTLTRQLKDSEDGDILRP